MRAGFMGQIIGVLELERHECGALGAPNCFPPTFSVATLKSIGLTGKVLQRACVSAVQAQELGRFCLQESGNPLNPLNAICGQGLWGESSCSKR